MKKTIISIFLISAIISHIIPSYADQMDNETAIDWLIREHIVNEITDFDEDTYTEYFIYNENNHIIGRKRIVGNTETVYTYTYNDDGTFDEAIEVNEIAEAQDAENQIQAYASSDFDKDYIHNADLMSRIEKCQKIWGDIDRDSTLTEEQKNTAKNEAHMQADIARADYCVVYPTSMFAYMFLPEGGLDTGTAFNKTITPSMSGQFDYHVMAIQRALIAYGYIDVTDIPINEYGYYGPTTQTAVREYQNDKLGYNTGNIAKLTIEKLFDYANATQVGQATFAMFSNINIFKGRHDAVCSVLYAKMRAKGYEVWRERYLYKGGLNKNGGRFDVAAKISETNKQVWEIKPDSSYGRATGPLQVQSYVEASNLTENLTHPVYKQYCPLVKGNNIEPGSIAWNLTERIEYYSDGASEFAGVVFYEHMKSGQAVWAPAPSPYILPKANEDYKSVSLPAGTTLKKGLVAAGVTIAAIFVIKAIVGILLAPETGGASLLLCF